MIPRKPRDQVRGGIGYGQDMNGGYRQFLRLTFARRIAPGGRALGAAKPRKRYANVRGSVASAAQKNEALISKAW